jgi:Holliday junction resolvasome RuvABC endonuclease subunit
VKRILGIDLSLNSTGWSILGEDGQVISFGTIKPVFENSIFRKQFCIKNAIDDLFEIYKLDYVIIEDVYYSKNTKTYCNLCQLLGIVISLCYKYVGDNIFVLPATHIRSCFGLKTKEEAFNFVVDKFNLLDFEFKKHNDICDSLLTGLSFLNKQKVIKSKKMLEIEQVINEPLENYLLKKYWTNDMDLQKISKELNIGYGTLYSWLQNLKIPIRSRTFYNDGLPDKLTYEQEQVLLGTILGWGYLAYSNKKHGDSCLQMEYSTKQIDYLRYKASIFDLFFGTFFENLAKETILFKTIYHKIFSIYRNLFYKDNVKIVTQEILNKIDPLAVAIWYMDDGYYHDNGHSGVIGLRTYSFTKNENELISEWFKEKFGVSFRVNRQGKYYYLKTGKKENVNRFIKIIDQYIIKSMKYKIKK